MTRIDLPSRRPHVVFSFPLDPLRTDGVVFTASLGFASIDAMRAGDTPVEVFLSCNKTTAIEAHGRDAAVLISLALQHGCSFDVMRAAITRLEPANPDERGAPASLAGRLLDEIERVTREEAMELGRR